MELSAYHNSREIRYRFPQGALKCLEGAVLKIVLFGADAPYAKVFLRLWADGSEALICGKREPTFSFINDGENPHEMCFSFHITAPETPQLIWYYFIIDVHGEKLYYGAWSGKGQLSSCVPPDYQITVYDPGFTTPKWFREGIVYQIFPDRFHRGGADAEGRTSLERASYHENMGRRVVRHEDWNEDVLYRALPGEKHYSPCDYYGGDLRGIIEKLPYLASLGVSVIYLNPIFEAASNHRYNTSDYLSVDPILGTKDDLAELVKAAEGFGIKLMLDGVFSHTGDDSVYFNKYGNYPGLGAYGGAKSPYYEWYDFRHFPDDYRSWWGFTTLPEIRELVPSYVEFIKTVLRHWAQLGISAWRLDVADELPDEFIRMLRTELKSMDPDALLLGEVWEDASNKEWAEGLRKYVYGHELDSVMNYPFRDAVCGFLTGHIDAYALNEALAGQRERYPEPFYHACMNILGSHDTHRILSVLGGAPSKNVLTRDQQAEFRLEEKQYALGKRRLFLASTLQYSMPQPPCVYYGDEVGMTGLSDPFNRATYPWGHEDAELVKQYRMLGELRRNNAALRRGQTAFLAVNSEVFAVFRRCENKSVITLINRSDSAQEIRVSAKDFTEGPDANSVRFAQLYRDAIGADTVVTNGEAISVALRPCTALILIDCS